MVSVDNKLFEKHGFKKLDKVELSRGEGPVTVPYPKPSKKFRIVHLSQNLSIEEYYYWILTHIKEDWGMYNVHKIKDIFTSSEMSAFWGASNQRLQIQQQNISNYMRVISEMFKGIFQMVREIRVMKERIETYEQANSGDESAEVMLKGFWVDLKDGGAQNPGSVYGLASQLGFSILPDLFFSAPLMTDSKDVDAHIKKLEKDFNKKVCITLARKLKGYVIWRENTYKELKTAEKFRIKYLRQQYDSINMYMSWVKPQIQNVKRLKANMEKNRSADLIGAFEGTAIEIEFLCTKPASGKYHSAVLVTMDYRTQPTMDFHTKDYQHRGPVHVGRVEITMRSYGWSEDDIDNYKRLREEENMELLSDMDETVKEALDSLGDELRNYLKEAGEKFPEDKKKEEEEKKKKARAKKVREPTVAEPFIEVFKGFGELFGTMIPLGRLFEKKEKPKDSGSAKGAAKGAEFVLWQTFKNFKASHGFVKW